MEDAFAQLRIDLGRVGQVTRVDSALLSDFCAAGVVPVIPSLALDAAGHWLNVNADTAAAAVAGSLQAEKLVFLTDTPGILRDRSNERSLIPSLNATGCHQLIAEGIIAAAKEVDLKVPLVVRLEGTNVEEGKRILADSGLAIVPANDLGDAARKIVAAVKEAA